MMKRIAKITTALIALSLIMSFSMSLEAKDKKKSEEMLKSFPQAQKGMVRYVIEVPEKSKEYEYKVEIIPGKNMTVDCNNHKIIGTLKEKDLDGWGYNYYEFTSDGQTRSTLMACDEPKKNKFVTSQTLTINYNSKLPIVVYAPKGFEIKYRIWKAEKENSAKKK